MWIESLSTFVYYPYVNSQGQCQPSLTGSAAMEFNYGFDQHASSRTSTKSLRADECDAPVDRQSDTVVRNVDLAVRQVD